MPVKILLVEDDAVDQMAFKRAIQKEQLDYDYKIAGSVSEALDILKSEEFDILLLDFNLGDRTAADLFPSIKDTPFIVATGSGDESKAVIAMKAGAYDYLVKDPERNYLKTLPYLVENAIKRKQTEKSLHEKEIYLQTVYDRIYEGIVTITPAGTFESLNISAEIMFGYSQAELIGKNTDILLPEAFFRSDEALYNHLRTGKIRIINSGFETDVKKKDGSIFTMEFTVSEIYPGGRWLYILACRDVTEQRRYERLLFEQTLKDGLTGLYNKKALSAILKDELERTSRYNRQMAVVMLDIDFFKNLNDTYGHLAGDQVLIGISKIILDNIRSVDKAIRWGGEEFIIILPETKVDDALFFAERLRSNIEASEFKVENDKANPLNLKCTVSIGVAGSDEFGKSEDVIVSAADSALYEAKQGGRNRVKRKG